MAGEKLNGRKILIVEDDFSSRLYLNKILEKSGMKILNAGDGKEAYDIILNDSSIDLVLMDIQLPVIDGYTCTKMLREAGVKTTIIAQTAYGLTGDKERLMSSGFNDYLIKPISQIQLFSKISDFLV
jgi:CheY-like chemotaxis protein